MTWFKSKLWRGFNWVGKYTFGSFEVKPDGRDRLFVHFFREHGFLMNQYKTKQDFVRENNAYAKHIKEIRRNNGAAPALCRVFVSHGHRMILLGERLKEDPSDWTLLFSNSRPIFASHFQEQYERVNGGWNPIDVTKDHMDEWRSIFRRTCSLDVLSGLERTYKWALKINTVDHDDFTSGWFYFLTNDLEIWPSIWSELEYVLHQAFLCK